MLVNALGFWAFGFPLSLLRAFRLDWGPGGLWWAHAAGPAVVAIRLRRVRIRFARELVRIAVEQGWPRGWRSHRPS